jgi:hypothetical protein
MLGKASVKKRDIIFIPTTIPMKITWEMLLYKTVQVDTRLLCSSFPPNSGKYAYTNVRLHSVKTPVTVEKIPPRYQVPSSTKTQAIANSAAILVNQTRYFRLRQHVNNSFRTD